MLINGNSQTSSTLGTNGRGVRLILTSVRKRNYLLPIPTSKRHLLVMPSNVTQARVPALAQIVASERNRWFHCNVISIADNSIQQPTQQQKQATATKTT